MGPRRMATVIREFRAAQVVTQEHLVERAEVMRDYIAQLETGHTADPSLPTLRKLAKPSACR